MAKKFYIGRRDNPQLPKPYFNGYGLLTKKDAAKKEDTLYGSMVLTSYDTEEEYETRINELKEEGFSVYIFNQKFT
jgi:hypothetical protein